MEKTIHLVTAHTYCCLAQTEDKIGSLESLTLCRKQTNRLLNDLVTPMTHFSLRVTLVNAERPVERGKRYFYLITSHYGVEVSKRKPVEICPTTGIRKLAFMADRLTSLRNFNAVLGFKLNPGRVYRVYWWLKRIKPVERRTK
jgi:hypothetical protein